MKLIQAVSNIYNGTRQGCPLSLRIFILTFELFLQQVCNIPDISGLLLLDYHYKVASYADNLFFYGKSNHFTTVPFINIWADILRLVKL